MGDAETKQAQDARIEMRCFQDEKDELQRAVDLERRPLSAWLLLVGLREAKKVLKRGK